MTSPRVSIIIVNWNNYADTSECLDSIRRVTYADFEVVVVDNGSYGDDVRLLRDGYGDWIRLIPNPRNDGFAEGCNIGIRDALARDVDYVVLLNNDTVVAPDFLDQLMGVVGSDPAVGIAGGKVYCEEIPNMIWFAGGYIDYNTGSTPIRGSGEIDGGQYEDVTDVEWICGCFMAISRGVLDSVGLLDRRFFFGWEDADLSIRAAREGYRIVFVPAAKVWHKTLPPEKQKRLSGKPVYYATRGHFIFMEKHLTKKQLLSAAVYYVARFPRFLRDYSKVLGQWKVPLYVLWAMADHTVMRLKAPMTK
jgi:hypothetical protein